ncbi:MAG: hypothetical protein J07HN4v3_00005 [Halonotius sp. J07HN4]|nr:MAG: hypothetical protein J07HN4v3_00005 [Halonotius sp. J07HN4]
MVPSINGETLLYALGVAFALGTLAFFARDVVFDLSITVTALLLFVAFAAFLVVGVAIDHDNLGSVAFAISGLSYMVGLGYVLSRYELSETGTFGLLAASTILFVGLGYGLQEGRLTLDRSTARRALLGLAVVGMVFVGADSVGEMTSSVDLNDEVVLNGTMAPPDEPIVAGEQRIGTVTIRNPTLFTRTAELPSLESCLVGADIDRPLRFDLDYDEPPSYQMADRLNRNEERTTDIRLRFDLPADAAATGQPIPIERAESCAVTRLEPTLLVVESADR